MAPTTTARSLSPDLLQRLGLLQPPFPASDSPDFVFSEAAHKTQINVALQLLQAGERILVIRGEQGLGKTAFLRGLQQRQATGLRFCRVAADEYLEFEELLGRFLRETGLVQADDEITPSLAAARLADAARAGDRPVLLLDDAERLGEAALERLLSVRADTVSEGAPFGLVLAVEPGFDGRLEALKGTALSLEQLHIIKLFAFSEHQTHEYVIQRLMAVGDVRGNLLSDADLRGIHIRSRGVPGLINQEATQRLIDRASGGGRGGLGKLAAGLKSRPRLLLAGGAVIAAGVAAAVVLPRLELGGGAEQVVAAAKPGATPYGVKVPEQYGFDKPAETAAPVMAAPPGVSLTSPSEPAPAETTPAAPAVAEAQTPETPVPESKTVAPQPVPPAAPVAAAPVEPKPAEAPVPAQAAPASTPAPTVVAETKPSVAPAAVAEAKPAPTPAPIAAKPAAEPAAPKPAADSGDWLAEHDARRFTIQLIAARDRPSLEAFIQEHGLGDRAAIVRTLRDGKDWYAVVSGDYASFKEAHGEIRNLPASLRGSGAFARRISTLRAAK